MENYDSVDSSTSGDLSAICEAAADPPDPLSGNGEHTTLIDVPICVDDSLSIQDNQNLTCDLITSHVEDGTFSLAKEIISDDCQKLTCDLVSPDAVGGTSSLVKETILDDCQKLTCDPMSSHVEDGTLGLVKETIPRDSLGTKVGNAPSKKCLDKSVSFPCSSKEIGETSAASAHSCLRSASLPTPAKLVPAMKGSREKLGSSPRKLSVTWAPDVYDPVPTSVSHVPTNKSHRHRSDGKKNGRSKQKGGGKSTHGSSRSKDKKQTRKVGGGSSRSYKTLFNDFPKDLPESLAASMADFKAGRANALCASSFLKISVAQLPFPVAETTSEAF